MSTQEEFCQQVKDALKHLYDYPHLEEHPLALRFWPRIGRRGPSRAQRLSRLLLETIEELNPAEASFEERSPARFYALLVYRYVEERPLADILGELSVSRRQFFREQQKAIAMLASLLREELPQRGRAPAGQDSPLASEAQRVLSERGKVALDAIIGGALETVGPLAEEHGVVVECEISPQLPFVYGTRTLLRQVFIKSLSSLIPQTTLRRIRIQARPGGEQARVRLIAEHNPSIPGSDESLDLREPELEAVRHLVATLGGQWRGALQEANAVVWGFGLPVDGDEVILIVEDNEAVIRAFRRYLVGHQYKVRGATSGAEALQVAREVRPAVIMLDVMMPGLDGWEILQELRDDPTTREIPVIICSVLDDPHLAFSLGATAYLSKPVSQRDLLSTLRTLTPAS
jgi:CheY-like chemotaxis protein